MQQKSNNDTPNLSSPSVGGGQGTIISLLVAAAENNVIGKDNQLPWNLPEDLKYFKNTSWGMTIVMGRKTFESYGKPLPGRKSVVITHSKEWSYPGVDVAHSIDEGLEQAKQNGAKEIFVIGGAEIFKSVLPQAVRIYITRIHHNFDGDAFFPEFSKDEWNVVRSRFFHADEKNKYSMTFEVWERTHL